MTHHRRYDYHRVHLDAGRIRGGRRPRCRNGRAYMTTTNPAEVTCRACRHRLGLRHIGDDE